jgi:hypothetical protein
MFRNFRLNRVVVSLSVLAVVLALGCPKAQAQVEPFRVIGAGTADYIPSTIGDAVRHDAVGTATHVGNYSGVGKVQLDAFTSGSTADFSSAVPFVFTAANGDKLAFHYGRTDFGAAEPGHVSLFPAAEAGKVIAVWVAEFNPVVAQCTGRFEQVTGGSFIMIAVTEPFVFGATDPVKYAWEGSGSIEFGRGD